MQFLKIMENCRTAEDMAKQIDDQLCGLTGAESVIIYIRDPISDTLSIIRSEKRKPKSKIEINPQSLAGWCAYYAEPLFLLNPARDERFNPSIDIIDSPEPERLLYIPVTQSGGIFGVLRITNPSTDPYGEIREELNDYIKSIPYAASSVVTGENLDHLTTRFCDIVILMTDSVTSEGGGHTMRVAQICSVLADILDLPAITCKNLWNAAIFHDLGKILMQGREPWEIDRMHAEAGAQYLEGIFVFKQFATIIRTSHARCDGTGIPTDVSGEDIPIENWILAVAEDMEEFFHINRYEFFEYTLRQFFVTRAESHHPLVLEAAAALAHTGKLEEIIRG